MRKHLGFSIIISLLAVFLLGCNKDLLHESRIHVKDARQIFEQSISDLESKGTKSLNRGGEFNLYLGEIIPEWDKSKTSHIGDLECLDTPLRETEYSYRAFYGSNGKRLPAEGVEFYSRLVSIRKSDSEDITNYIVFYIPSYTYSKTHKDDKFARKLLNGSQKQGDFSGVKIWTRLDGSLVRVNRYRDGDKTVGISLLGCKSKEELSRRFQRAILMLGPMNIQRGHKDRLHALTKSAEDNSADWILVYDDLYYNMGDGHLYWDSDGDGIPETLCDIGGAGIVDSANGGNDGQDPDWNGQWDDNGVNWSGGGSSSGGSGAAPGNGVKLSLDGITYLGYLAGVNNCYQVATDLARQFGAITLPPPYYTMFLEDATDKKLVAQLLDPATDAECIIREYLDDGIPVVVGVHYKYDEHINDSTVDHWVLVYGYGWDDEGFYLDYNETNRSQAFWDATHGDIFKFRLDSDHDWYWAYHYNSPGNISDNPIYIMTSIRYMTKSTN